MDKRIAILQEKVHILENKVAKLEFDNEINKIRYRAEMKRRNPGFCDELEKIKKDG